MNPFVLILPILFVSAAVVYGVLRALGQVWMEHKARLALLDKLERRPDLIPSFQELQTIISSVSPNGHGGRQDWTLTGTLLALIGLASAIGGKSLNMGRVSVGVYFGGIVCLCLGFVLALFGLLIRNMTRSVMPAADDDIANL
ncbi:MAG TPA: hypothetical protein PLO37_05710 [Candidatus Hydrogenedentes bacterium]|mgnify:CR=1 FL=1|nr:hypothetical protein [Candidatus Hydrogenedentota bacterium]HPG66324.1 hypothetical protein [Candidatus Hydrogenedentota bacterium]